MALRHIWNSCFWVDPTLRNWDSVYSFRELKAPLFKALVADPLGVETEEIFGKAFHVVPEMIHARGLSWLLVNARLPDSPDGGIWNQVPGPFKKADIELTLVDLFDWTQTGYIDLRYYLVLIESCQGHPEIVGHHALIDVNDASVMYEDGNIAEE